MGQELGDTDRTKRKEQSKPVHDGWLNLVSSWTHLKLNMRSPHVYSVINQRMPPPPRRTWNRGLQTEISHGTLLATSCYSGREALSHCRSYNFKMQNPWAGMWTIAIPPWPVYIYKIVFTHIKRGCRCHTFPIITADKPDWSSSFFLNS